MKGMASVVLILVGILSLAQAQCLDPNCATCADPKVCTSCNVGGSGGLDAQGFCITSCVRGYYYNSTDLECKPCPSTCYRCDSPTVCTGCDTGYGLNLTSNSCVACPTHAILCQHDVQNNFMVVTLCDPEYYISADTKSCPMCPTNLPQCDQCYNSTICASCNDGYFVNATGQCQACIAHCTMCLDGTNTGCTQCDTGYEEQGGDCFETSCSSTYCNRVGQLLLPGKGGMDCGGACSPDQCCGGVASGFVGYFRFDKPGTTNDCLDYAGVVIDKLGCTDVVFFSYNWTCQGGSFNQTNSDLFDTTCGIASFWDGTPATCVDENPNLGTGSAVVICPDSPHCEALCTACINGQCNACLPGYGVNAAHTCVACETNCIRCSSPTACDECNEGFWLNNGDCTACPMNCTTCDDAATCTSCTSGHWLNGGACDGCSVVNCNRCPNDNCNRCDTPYAYNPIANNCTRVPDNCTNYNFDAAGALICTSCSNGFYAAADGSQCIPCTNLCSRCRLQTGVYQCLTCASGTYVNSTTGLCTACNATIPYCDACVERYSPGGLYCTSCQAGKGFTRTAQKCEACVKASNCDQCLSYQYDQPKPGKYCQTCLSGYTLDQDRLCKSTTTSGSSLTVPTVGVMIAVLFALLFN